MYVQQYQYHYYHDHQKAQEMYSILINNRTTPYYPTISLLSPSLFSNPPFFLPLGYGMMACVRLGTDQDSGRPRGFAHVDFFTPEMAQAALAKLPGVVVGGRELRIDMKKRITERIAGENLPLPPRDWGESSARGTMTSAWLSLIVFTCRNPRSSPLLTSFPIRTFPFFSFLSP